LKYYLSPETAIDTFIKSKKENKDVPEKVLESLRNYKKWEQNSLIGLLNASAYFPEILIEEKMEEQIYKLLAEFKKSIVHK
jgi:predicted transcriptional regulator